MPWVGSSLFTYNICETIVHYLHIIYVKLPLLYKDIKLLDGMKINDPSGHLYFLKYEQTHFKVVWRHKTLNKVVFIKDDIDNVLKKINKGIWKLIID